MPIRSLSFALTTFCFAACTADLVPVPPRNPPDAAVPAAPRASAGRGAAPSRGLDPRFAPPEPDAAATSDVDAALDPPDADDAGKPAPPSERAPSPTDRSTPPPPAPTMPAGRPPDVPPPPAATSCIDDRTPGDRVFGCRGLTFHVVIDPQCTERACGLIVDIHGAGMAAAQMRDTTGLHELAPPRGYLVVHPSATPDATGGSWSADQYPLVAAFLDDMLEAFHVDRSRVHVTGFSQGADMAFWLLCNRPSSIASAAAVTRSNPAADCIGPSWKPQVPLLYMHGATDALTIGRARTMIEEIAALLALGEPTELESDTEYSRQRWLGPGMQLDYIEHMYARAFGAGHCVPGGKDTPDAPNNLALNSTTCTIGNIRLHWGALALQWFLDHPRPVEGGAGP